MLDDEDTISAIKPYSHSWAVVNQDNDSFLQILITESNVKRNFIVAIYNTFLQFQILHLNV